MCPIAKRIAAWNRLRIDLPADKLEALTIVTRLEEVPRFAAEILAGKVRGRIVVDVNN
jgi:acrylyl-CoA reductase (NADPH)